MFYMALFGGVSCLLAFLLLSSSDGKTFFDIITSWLVINWVLFIIFWSIIIYLFFGTGIIGKSIHFILKNDE